MEHIQKIRQACIAANPSDDRWNVILADEEKVRLADVLLAIGENKDICVRVDTKEQIDASPFKGDTQWNLREDDLAKQSQECLEFISGLLSNQE